MSTPVLEVSGVTVRFGGVFAVTDVSFEMRPGEIVGLIGPNGAGKTTLFEAIAGFTPTEQGRIVLEGRDLSSQPPQRRAARGLVRSFQDAALFDGLTVRQTLMLAQHLVTPMQTLRAMVGTPSSARSERTRLRRAEELIASFGLGAFADKLIAELSTGTRRICELAASTSLEPKVLLLDEPSSGLAQREVEAMPALLRRLREETGAALVIVEHDMPLIMGLAGRIIALETGQVIAEGSPRKVQNDPAVIRSYLGRDVRAIKRSGRRRRT